jgi:hypothetical protein|tara:strand:- start:669 stop:851 length:183 start_codon:yes stop_codon:yes gene_type:complete
MKLNLSLIIFMMGIFFITAGYANQVKPSCKEGVEIKYVTKDLYDEISQEKPYMENHLQTL